jgi:hypothetical protein
MSKVRAAEAAKVHGLLLSGWTLRMLQDCRRPQLPCNERSETRVLSDGEHFPRLAQALEVIIRLESLL